MPRLFTRLVLGVVIATTTVSSAFASNLLANNAFSYIGQPANNSTNLLTLGGYRHYNPTQGTFLKQDSYSPFATNRTFNGFNYSAGNPVLFADQSGHLSVLDSALIAGASILAATFVGIGIYRGIAMSGETSDELVGETSAENALNLLVQEIKGMFTEERIEQLRVTPDEFDSRATEIANMIKETDATYQQYAKDYLAQQVNSIDSGTQYGFHLNKIFYQIKGYTDAIKTHVDIAQLSPDTDGLELSRSGTTLNTSYRTGYNFGLIQYLRVTQRSEQKFAASLIAHSHAIPQPLFNNHLLPFLF